VEKINEEAKKDKWEKLVKKNAAVTY